MGSLFRSAAISTVERGPSNRVKVQLPALILILSEEDMLSLAILKFPRPPQTSSPVPEAKYALPVCSPLPSALAPCTITSIPPIFFTKPTLHRYLSLSNRPHMSKSSHRDGLLDDDKCPIIVGASLPPIAFRNNICSLLQRFGEVKRIIVYPGGYHADVHCVKRVLHA